MASVHALWVITTRVPGVGWVFYDTSQEEWTSEREATMFDTQREALSPASSIRLSP